MDHKNRTQQFVFCKASQLASSEARKGESLPGRNAPFRDVRGLLQNSTDEDLNGLGQKFASLEYPPTSHLQRVYPLSLLALWLPFPGENGQVGYHDEDDMTPLRCEQGKRIFPSADFLLLRRREEPSEPSHHVSQSLREHRASPWRCCPGWVTKQTQARIHYTFVIPAAAL